MPFYNNYYKLNNIDNIEKINIVFEKNFHDGDLLYGFGHQIDFYIDNIYPFNELNFKDNIFTVIQYNHGFREAKSLDEIKIASNAQSIDFIKSINSNNIYDIILSNEYNNKIHLNIMEYWQKKSKAGLCWAKESNKNIHYILDELDYNAVINKQKFLDEDGIEQVSVSSSELRWIYRNRNDPDVQKSVQFWKNGRPANAPWADDPEMWSRYKPRSEVNIIQQAEHHRNPVFARRRQRNRDAMLNELSYA